MRRQHGVISHKQLREAGVHPQAIKRRVASGRLHRVRRGVYAAGRPELTDRGRWMAAVLYCGTEAVLSHDSAAALWGIRSQLSGPIHLSVPVLTQSRAVGIRVHRRASLEPRDVTRRERIPVTSPARTLIDLATRLAPRQLEAAVNAADKLDLVDPERLRAAVTQRAGMDGVPALRALLDGRTFRLTDSELERRFLRLVRAAGLPEPRTGRRLNGYRVDFHWPDLGLVVETDGLRYHRTPAQQARDRERDQAHAAAGLTPLRFTHAQVARQPGRVAAILEAVTRRLDAARVPDRKPRPRGTSST
ncbi:MAG TPA: type IV toxin-antitoxin system AbiEi family antitoxin domain-containing protein [Solirubrobacterales bacterium]|nr:type IV toxin-antitoxin system AbiEi family antitoxin domain-containing protein [Solirubrobacterales bacterium]